MDIFTIGHSNYSIGKFLDMLNYFNINCVVDIRGTPYSKYNIQYNREVIRQTLLENNIIYIYMAKEFAVQRENKSLYVSEGYADFEKVRHDKEFLQGIERLKIGISKGYKIALMGAMQDPINCHRCILVGRALVEEGFNVKHILDDCTVTSQKNMEEKLLEKYFINGSQITFETIENRKISIEDMIKESYRRSNKEIGYRVEKLNK